MTKSAIQKRWKKAKQDYATIKDVDIELKTSCMIKKIKELTEKEPEQFTEEDMFNLCICKLIIDDINTQWNRLDLARWRLSFRENNKDGD